MTGHADALLAAPVAAPRKGRLKTVRIGEIELNRLIRVNLAARALVNANAAGADEAEQRRLWRALRDACMTPAERAEVREIERAGRQALREAEAALAFEALVASVRPTGLGGWTVASKTRPDTVYAVYLTPGGMYVCDCEAGNRRQTCAHTRAVSEHFRRAALARERAAE